MSEPAKIYPAMAAIMAKVEAIGKDRVNEQQRFKFRGIEDVMNALHQHFSEAGVFIMPEVLERDQVERQTKTGNALFYSFVRVRYTFVASDGSQVSAIGVGEGMDSADKSTNKAMSAALKYVLTQALLIPTEDNKDGDAETPGPVQPRQATRPQADPIAAFRADLNKAKTKADVRAVYNRHHAGLEQAGHGQTVTDECTAKANSLPQ